VKKLLIILLSITALLSTPAYTISWDPIETIPSISPPSEARGAVSLAYDNINGLMFAAWLDDSTGTPFFSIFNNILGTWSMPAQIANAQTNNAIYLSYDSSARIMVATWNDSGTNNPFYSFYNGTDWSNAAAISNAVVVFDGVRTTYRSRTGNIIAAWSDNNFPFNPFYSIYISGYDTWSIPETIAIEQVFDDVTLTYDNISDQVFAAWIANNTGLPSYATLTAGVWTSGSISLTDPASTQSKNVLLTYDNSNQQVYAAWGATQPLVAVFSNTNQTWSAPIAISNVGTLNSEVALAYSSASEQVVAAWLDSGIPRYAITNSAGANWTEGFISPNPVASTAISLAFDSGLNEMFVAWSNATTSNPADPVYSALLTPTLFPDPAIGPVISLKGAKKVNRFFTASDLANQLSWFPPAPGVFPVLGYHIYRDETLIATLPHTKLSFQDHNRKPGVSYSYAVAAFDVNGEGPQTAIAL
jgi:hypothetical protein